MRSTGWRPKPISRTCEHREGNKPCGDKTCFVYRAMGSGYMALCAHHAEKHMDYAEVASMVVAQGGEWAK